MRIDTFARVHGFEFPRPVNQDSSVAQDKILPAEDEEEDIEIEEWKRDVREALRSGTPTAARKALDDLGAELTFAPGKRVAEFGSFLIANKGAWGKRAALSTVRLHTRNVANLLCDVLGGKDPVELPAADLSTYLL